MKVHIFRDGETLSELDLADGEYLIGSGESAHLRLPGESVALEHARLKIGSGGVEVEDLGSGRGTFLGDLALNGAQPVPDGSILQFGEIALQIWDGGSPAEAAPELPEGSRYAIGEVVAEGAMGVIRRARELSTGRDVAMKQMHEELADGSAAGARFVQEAKITAHLEHPNVVPVHDVGHGAGGPSFYTMKMVRGISLEKVLELLTQHTATALKKYPLEALLTIFQKVCDALAFAHSKGIIHRDLKPANLMVGEYGEVLVMDWGLAKLVGEAAEELPAADPDDFTGAGSSSVTLAGTVMGTPYYMAPEQAAGDIALVDERSDIYSLGAILYELLTLQTSVEGHGSKEVLRKVCDGKITPILRRAGKTPLPHLPGGKIPASLAAVAMKALAYSPERRYQRVTDLQAEIRAFQSGFATGAESAGTWRQITLLVKRHKAVATAIAASVVLIGVLTAIYTAALVRESDRANAERDRANLERDRAKAAFAQGETERERANRERSKAEEALGQTTFEKKRAEDALTQANSEKMRAEEALTQVEGQRRRADSEADKAKAALTQVTLEKKLTVEALAQVAPEKKRTAAALEDLRKTAPAVAVQAQTLSDQQKAGEAIERISFAISLDPKNPDYLLRRANWLQSQLRLKEAVQDYRQALSMRDDPLGKTNLTICEKILRDNQGRAELKTESRGELYEALKKQARLVEAGLLSTSVFRANEIAEAAIKARLQPLVRVPGFGWNRVRSRSNGTFDITFGGLPIAEIPDLSGLPISKIYFDNTKVTKFPRLAGLPLEKLDFNNTSLADLAGVEDLPLKELHLYGTKISNISPLRGMALTHLYLSRTQVSDLSPVTELAALEILDVADTACSDLSPLQGRKIRTLRLNGTQVRDLADLRGLPIEELRLDSTSVTDISVLETLPLKRLTIYDCHDITDFKPLANCKQLEVLQIRKTSRDVSFLRFLPNLHRLTDEEIPGFSFDKIPAAAAFWKRQDARLAAISVVRAAVAKLCSGADKANISEAGDNRFNVDVSNLPVRDLGPLRGLSLNSLRLGSTPITDLSPLAGMPIETLSLDGCKNLIDLSPLAKLPRLRDVNLVGSGVRDLKALRGLHLVETGVGATAVTDLSPFRGQPLVSICFEDAPVTDASPLLDCPKIERVLLSRAVRNVESLRKHPSITHLSYDWDGSKGRPAQTAQQFWAEFDRTKMTPK